MPARHCIRCFKVCHSIRAEDKHHAVTIKTRGSKACSQKILLLESLTELLAHIERKTEAIDTLQKIDERIGNGATQGAIEENDQTTHNGVFS
jgi:hypothetical protein